MDPQSQQSTGVVGDQKLQNPAAVDSFQKAVDKNDDFGACEYQRDSDKPLGGVGNQEGHLKNQATDGDSVGSGGHKAGHAIGAPKYQSPSGNCNDTN